MDNNNLNNFATSEQEIVTMALRLSAAGTQVGMTDAQILALSTSLSSLGITAEAGGSAMSKLLFILQSEVESGGESLEDFASIAGMTGEEFTIAFRDNAYDATVKFFEGLNRMSDEGVAAISTLNQLDISEVRLRDTTLRSSNGFEIFQDAVARANVAWEQNTALTDEASKRYATTESQIELVKNKFKEISITLGEQFLPIVSDILDKVSQAIDWFGSLDTELQTNIVKWGLMTAAVGVTTSVVGKLVSTFGKVITSTGSIVKGLGGFATSLYNARIQTAVASAAVEGFTASTAATAPAIGLGTKALALLAGNLGVVAAGVAVAGAAIYTYHEYQDAMTDSVTKSREEMSLLERAFHALNGTVTYSKKELEDMNLVYEDFNDNVSKDFKESAEEMRTACQELRFEMDLIDADNIITEEEVSNVESKFGDMVERTIGVLEDKKEEVQVQFKETFTMDDNTIDEGEQTLLNYWNSQYDISITEVQRMGEEVNEILRKTREDGYQMTEGDKTIIKTYYTEMGRIQLEAEAENEEEMKYQQELFRQQVKHLDAAGAQELATQRRDQLQDTVDQENAYYEVRKKKLEEALDSNDEAVRLAAEAELLQLESYHNTKIEGYEDERRAIYDTLIESNSNLKGVIDRFNLEIFEGEDKAANDRLNNMKEKYGGMEEVTETSTQRMWNDNKKCWTDVTTIVDEKTGEITGIIETYTNAFGKKTREIVGYNEEYERSTEDLAKDIDYSYNVISRRLESFTGYSLNNKNQVVGHNGEIIGSLQLVEDEAGDLVYAIKDVNGNPIDIQGNWGSATTGILSLREALDKIDGRVVPITIQENRVATGTSVMGSNIPTYNDGMATGGYVREDALAYTNERYAGWELTSKPASVLYEDNFGAMTKLSAGTRVYSHSASVAMMQSEIQSQLAAIDFSSLATANSYGSQQLTQGVQQLSSQSNSAAIDYNKLGDVLLKAIMSGLSGVQLSNSFNVGSRQIVSELAPLISNSMAIQNKRRGR